MIGFEPIGGAAHHKAVGVERYLGFREDLGVVGKQPREGLVMIEV